MRRSNFVLFGVVNPDTSVVLVAMPSETSKRYDDVPYESLPFEHSHPSWLATVAALFGLSSPPPGGARILELGCASGGNLIPLAEALPGSSCLGVDLSARQIADGQALIAATGLSNIELRQASILDIDASYGAFDYIICHGVYSWVTPDIQQRILEICGNRLTPNGLAYISYNTYPGWRMHGMLREMMQFHAGRFREPAQQIAQSRALLEVLAKAVPSEGNPYGMLLKRESEHLRGCSDWYIYHEQLEETNDPVYFHEFIRRASSAGLEFVAESEVRSMLTSQFSEEVQAALREVATNLIYAEQYMDFFRNRAFRESILCRRGAPLKRKLDAQCVRSFSFASALRPFSKYGNLRQSEALHFEAPGYPSIDVVDPRGKAALLCLCEAWPRALSFDELESAVRARLELGAATDKSRAEFAELMWYWFLQQIVSITVTSPNCVAKAGERPMGLALARAQAKAGRTTLTNGLHRSVKLNSFDTAVLTLLDGTRDRTALVSQLAESGALHGETSAADSEPLERRVNAALAVLAEAALLRG